MPGSDPASADGTAPGSGSGGRAGGGSIARFGSPIAGWTVGAGPWGLLHAILAGPYTRRSPGLLRLHATGAFTDAHSLSLRSRASGSQVWPGRSQPGRLAQ